MTMTKRLACLAAALVLAGSMAASTANAASSSCFWSSEYWRWKAADAKTIYIRVGIKRFFRLDLSAACHNIEMSNVFLVTTIRGSNLICNGIDWDLRATQDGGSAEGCIVKSMTALTPDEAAAIPSKFKP
jgi:hypothetical protein